MAATICATTTRNIAYNAIMAQEVRRLTSAEYTTKDFIEFEKDITMAAKSVPSTLGGGEHGHSWLVKDTAGYQKFTKDPSIVQAEIPHPGSIDDIATNDSHATIARKTAKKAELLSTYYTQSGCADGLRDLIIRRVPKSTIEDLQDADDGFASVSALELLDHLRDQADIVDVVDVNALLKERDEPMDFEGTTSLKVFFKNLERIIKQLKDDHQIASSHSELIIRYLLQIGKVDSDIMRSAVDKWNALSKVARTWAKFKTHFAAADKKRREAIKAREPFTRTDHQANNTTEGLTPEDMSAMFAAAFETFASGAEESINAAIDSKFKHWEKSSSGTAAATNDDKIDDLHKQIDTLQRKLASQAKKDEGGEADRKKKWEPEPGAKPCKYCNKHHRTPEERCWAKKENRKYASAGWKRANPE